MVRTTLRRMECCGWKEVICAYHYRPGKLLEFISNIASEGYIGRNAKPKFGALLITQATVKAKYGKNLASDIEAAGLGKVISLEPFINPNTRHKINSYVWYVDVNAMVNYVRANNIRTHERFW